MGHERFELPLINTADGCFMSHLRERMGHTHHGDRLCHGIVLHDFHAVHMTSRAGGIAFGDSFDLGRGLILDCDPRFDESSGVLACERDLLLDLHIVVRMSENTGNKLDHGILACGNVVIDIELADPPIHRV